ncbi:single-stranded-DNA-specific exonuclease RecJ [Treponema sp.]|uniref:single-stranded-DNA-specific exonuclease RecJ n=1 Tax=Treponema sp. TaxID=166 RepID=UPI0038909616
MNWNKTNVLKSDVEAIQHKYGVDAITASILIRRGITNGRDIFYFLEDDLRYQHNPFLFNGMEDAVDRILAAAEKDENGNSEKVLIFGDRDVDGVTATTVLYECLISMGVDVQYRVPEGDDAYGLSIEAIDDFASQYGSLIITVDCGIANVDEVAYAQDKGIDVIVTDHHNPQGTLPSPAIILDAKTEGSGYPFQEISGCALTYKLASALRFAKSKWYKTDVALLNARTEDDNLVIECIKVRNLVPMGRLTETIVPGEKSISDTKLPKYLQGQLILCWNVKETSMLLKQAFGNGAEFNMLGMQDEISRFFPSLRNSNLDKIKTLSKIAKYGDHLPTEIGGFYNIFVTYVQQSLKKENPTFVSSEEKELQLVALAAIADIMPLVDENRIFVRKGIEYLNAGRARKGLIELLSQINLLGKRITSKDIGWSIDPKLNAAGRLGHAGIATELFTSEDPVLREQMAKKIIELNEERKTLTNEAENATIQQAQSSIENYSGKLCVVFDESIFKGVSGILASRYVEQFGIPAIVMSTVGDVVVGSMRSCRGFDVTEFLENMKDIFISHGGHDFAAGFSLERKNLEKYLSMIKENASSITLLPEEESRQSIDAEVPADFMTPELINIVDRFEPYGNENENILFMSRNLPIMSAQIVGKTDKTHLKLTLDCGKTKWPAMYWGAGNLLHNEIEVGDKVDILFGVERNVFNGTESLQLNIKELRKSL